MRDQLGSEIDRQFAENGALLIVGHPQNGFGGGAGPNLAEGAGCGFPFPRGYLVEDDFFRGR
jgi:hypothetical protein